MVCMIIILPGLLALQFHESIKNTMSVLTVLCIYPSLRNISSYNNAIVIELYVPRNYTEGFAPWYYSYLHVNKVLFKFFSVMETYTPTYECLMASCLSYWC